MTVSFSLVRPFSRFPWRLDFREAHWSVRSLWLAIRAPPSSIGWRNWLVAVWPADGGTRLTGRHYHRVLGRVGYSSLLFAKKKRVRRLDGHAMSDFHWSCGSGGTSKPIRLLHSGAHVFKKFQSSIVGHCLMECFISQVTESFLSWCTELMARSTRTTPCLESLLPCDMHVATLWGEASSLPSTFSAWYSQNWVSQLSNI